MASFTIPRKFSKQFKTFVVQTVHEVLTDPDFGLELKESVKKRLRRARVSRGRTISLLEIKRRYL